MKFVSPTPTYRIPLPDDVITEYDGKVASFWREGSSTLLQVSSTVRTDGIQISAAERLHDLLNRCPGDWSPLKLHPENFPGESAAAEMQDENGLKWIHIYLTTSWLAIYATISGQPTEFSPNSSARWPPEAIHGLQLTLM